jgi:hypothetical protein
MARDPVKASHALRSGSLQAWPVALRPRSLPTGLARPAAQAHPRDRDVITRRSALVAQSGGKRSERIADAIVSAFVPAPAAPWK